MTRPKLLAYAQLLRLPNVFTAFADIGLAGCAAGYVPDRPGTFALVLLASGCLYLGGMVTNDLFDRREDARDRPFRPLPSGRVAVGTATIVGAGLLMSGLGFALAASDFPPPADGWTSPVAVAGVLAAAVLLYNGWLKRTPAGPLGMGLCRFLNVLLGLSVAGPDLLSDANLHLAGVIGLYIVGVTWFARTEEAASNRRPLMLAAGVMLAAALVGLAVPAHLAPGRVWWAFPYLLTAFGFAVGVPVVRAINRPDPKHVQAAVKRSILGLVALDAVLATAFVGWPGLLVLGLLPPAVYLGKWVYST